MAAGRDEGPDWLLDEMEGQIGCWTFAFDV